jgi:hypothetical protein
MICKSFRDVSNWQLNLTLGLCLIAGGMAAVVPSAPAWVVEASTVLTLRTPELPVAALEKTAGVRLQKHAPTGRFILQKPTRSFHLAATEIFQAKLHQPRTHQVFRDLPRRMLLPRRLTLLASDDGADPYLS